MTLSRGRQSSSFHAGAASKTAAASRPRSRRGLGVTIADGPLAGNAMRQTRTSQKTEQVAGPGAGRLEAGRSARACQCASGRGHGRTVTRRLRTRKGGLRRHTQGARGAQEVSRESLPVTVKLVRVSSLRYPWPGR